uniref:Putative phosphotransferase n=1 Tax=Amycolatopsis sp. SANK 60206 TaxID=1642649 RepID=A0A0E3Z8Y2_9PSEU|nr:putative phosphotransferase [Amycolatopsis sp. SANK 60206]
MAHPDPAAFLAASGIDHDRVRACIPLGDGTYNAVQRVERAGAPTLILKIAPNPAAPAMTYEKDLLSTEAEFYRVAGRQVPVPHPVWSGRVDDFSALLMTELPGRSWHSVDKMIDSGESRTLRHDLGRMVGGLHQVTGAGFGYPQFGLRRSWAEAFVAMTDAVLGDAERYEVSLPRPVDDLRQLVKDAEWALAEVREPVLVHFDLWPGNILVVIEPSPCLSGIVDAERAFWGDPLAELASLGLFGKAEEDADLVAGYTGAGGVIGDDKASNLRLSLYRAYLYMIMTIEAVPRGNTGPEHEEFRLLIERHLRAELQAAEAG